VPPIAETDAVSDPVTLSIRWSRDRVPRYESLTIG
jgi:hypothetical protein